MLIFFILAIYIATLNMPDMKIFSDLWYVDIHLLHSLKGHLSIIGYIARISIVYIYFFLCVHIG